MVFILDTSTLGGNSFAYAESIFEDRGRSVTIEWSQSGANQDIELYGFAIRFAPGEAEPKESF